MIPEKNHKTACILGTPTSSGNRGVLALGSSLASLCLEHSGVDEVVILEGKRDSNPFDIRHKGKNISLRVVNYRMAPSAIGKNHIVVILFLSILFRLFKFTKFRNYIKIHSPWIHEVDRACIVGDVRGGDSFSDIYGIKRFLLSSLPILSIILIRGDISLFPQTYGPFKGFWAKRLAKFTFKNSSYIAARDTESQSECIRIMKSDKPVVLSPDVAFSLSSIAPISTETDPIVDTIPTKDDIGINVNGLVYNGGYTKKNMFDLRLDYPKFLRDLIIELSNKREVAKIWLVPHTYSIAGNVESDNAACEALRESLPTGIKSQVILLKSTHDQYEIKNIIGNFGFFIGTRMHACIAALSQSVPCIGVAYSKKFYGVFESVGAEEFVVDGRLIDNKEAIETCIDLYAKTALMKQTLQRTSKSARQKLAKVFTDLGNIPYQG